MGECFVITRCMFARCGHKTKVLCRVGKVISGGDEWNIFDIFFAPRCCDRLDKTAPENSDDAMRMPTITLTFTVHHEMTSRGLSNYVVSLG